eukprot:TRINITY_DN29219_c0_g1_i1.p1 TRINITY_DN29219_c0_g1~~TRINITY_DN29219_c0_g1_i1.p1  ORF type:complete len:626 (-),score=142.50 TRINITY_DN29219_c0_g1_i1:123-2000(-)
MSRQSSKGYSDRFEFLTELLSELDIGLRYHREARDVKVKVGNLGFLGVLMFGVLFGGLIYLWSTQNMYFESHVPVGQVSIWGGGAGGVAATADTQEQGPLCSYARQFDYMYGLDSYWDYTVNGCVRLDLSSICFKGVGSLHFVTYQQKRQEVILRSNGDGSCDDECQTVYPNWPTSASYGNMSYKRIHVETAEHIDMTYMNPAIAGSADLNVLVQKPQRWGANKCRCFSMQNAFVLGADSASVEFTHSYDTHFLSGSSKEGDAHDPTSFLTAEDGMEPFKVFEKGTTMSFVLSEAMEALGQGLDAQPRDPFYGNDLCVDGVCPDGVYLQPVPRMAGAQIDIRTEYYNKKVAMPKGKFYDHIKLHYEPPYAIHVLRLAVDWASRGSDVVAVEESFNRTVNIDTYRYGVLVKLGPAGGVISRLDFNVIVNNLVNLVVLLSFPGTIMSLIVFYGCGSRSKLLRKGRRCILSIEQLFRSLAFNAVVAHKIFKDLDTDGSGHLNKKQLYNILYDMLLPRLRLMYPDKDAEWYEDSVMALVDELSDDFIGSRMSVSSKLHGSIMGQGVSRDEFIRGCTLMEPFDFKDLLAKTACPNVEDLPLTGLRKRVFGGSQAKVSPAIMDPAAPTSPG